MDEPRFEIVTRKHPNGLHSVKFYLDGKDYWNVSFHPSVENPEGSIMGLVSAATLTALALGESVKETLIDYWEDKPGTVTKIHRP